MAVPHETLMEIWYTALASYPGIAVPSSDKVTLARELYKARQESKDDRLAELTIQQPAKSNELWICHKAVEIPDA